MINQYKNGWVRQHSIEMGYVKIFFAVNDKDYKEEYAAWEQYADLIVNIDDVIKNGSYFWGVLVTKLFGGAAVPAGSNWVTPTLELIEPLDKALDIIEEPSFDTRKDWKVFINNLRN